MAHPEVPTPRTTNHVVLAGALIFVLAAVSASTGLVAYTAWIHDLKDGVFALLFATLSTRAALSWVLWRESDQRSAIGFQQGREGRKPADGTTQ